MLGIGTIERNKIAMMPAEGNYQLIRPRFEPTHFMQPANIARHTHERCPIENRQHLTTLAAAN